MIPKRLSANRKLSRFFLISLLVISLIAPAIPQVNADGESWLTGWIYRKSHTIEHTSAGAQTDYQVVITIEYGAGVDSAETVYLDSKCKTDFGDIRFTNSSGEDLLDYWIEEKTDSDDATFWVEVDTIPAHPNNATIYIYYGKADATTTSHGYATFLFFDDFPGAGLNGTKWPTTAGTPIVGGGELSLNDDDNILSGTSFGYNVAIVAKSKSDEQDIVFVSLSDANIILANNQLRISNSDITFPDDFDKYYSRSIKGGVARDVLFDTGLDFRNTYYLYQVRRIDGNVTFYQESTLINTEINPLYLPIVNLKPHFGVWDSSQESTLTVDWVFVRKYVDPEPVHGAWGPEESIQPPSDPTLLFGAGFNASSPYVELHWNHSLIDVQFFEVQNSSDGVSWDYLGQSTKSNYSDTQVLNGTERYYRVRACNQTGGNWYNSSFTDINFETVYFIPGVSAGPGPTVFRNVTGEWFYYNLTSINVTFGTHDTGTVNSTLDIDGDTWNCSEVVGAPGYRLKFNWTEVDPDASCLWIVSYVYYDGVSAHVIDIELYNFTSSAWVEIGNIVDMTGFEWVNASIYDLRMPNDFINSTGAVLGRFNHVSAGNTNDDIHVEFLKLYAFIPFEDEAVTEENFFWIFIAIVLSILTALLVWMKYGDNNN